MKLIYKLLVCLCLLYLGKVQAQQVTKNIQHVQQYKTAKDASVELVNKYGNIDITNWDKDSVKIIVDISLTAKSEDKLNRLVSYTNIDFVHSGDFVSAKTRLGTSKLSTEISVRVDDSFGASDVTVKYTVFMPSNASLEVTNSFGDIYLHSRKGETEVNLSHGEFRGGKLEEDLKITASYAKVKIKEAVSIDLELKHCSGTHIKKADKISLTSSYSSLTIDEVGQLRIASKKDKIEIGEVNTIYGSCSLPNILIESVHTKIDLSSRMIGSIVVSEVSKDFESVVIKTDYSSIDLNFQSADFQFKLVHKSSTFTYPASLATLKTVDNTTQKHAKITTGIFGDSPSKKLVDITAEDSNIKFTFNL